MKITKIEMDTDTFIKIQDNPIQRDTVNHAKKAVKRHLKEYTEPQRVVAIAQLTGSKKRWKVDGHTRSLLWDSGKLKAPTTVYVTVYHISNEEELIELYSHFDNKDAAETRQDQLTGALNYLKISGISRMRTHKLGILSAITLIDRALKRSNEDATVLVRISPYKKELTALLEQGWMYNTKQGQPGTPSCVTGTFLILSKLYGNDCLGFWSGYNTGKGMDSTRSGRDGSKAAVDWILRARNNNTIAGRDSGAYNIIALLKAYEFYRKRKNVERITTLVTKNANQSSTLQLGVYLKELGYS